MPDFLFFFGLAAIIIGFPSLRFGWKRVPAKRHRIGLILIGCVLAALANLARYYINPSTIVVGLPFSIAIFQLRDDTWLDFVGPTSLFCVIGNVLVSILVPWIILAMRFLYVDIFGQS